MYNCIDHKPQFRNQNLSIHFMLLGKKLYQKDGNIVDLFNKL